MMTQIFNQSAKDPKCQRSKDLSNPGNQSKSSVRSGKSAVKFGILAFWHFGILSKKGFTIIEMFFVVMIIAILTTIGTRTYFDERDRFIFNDTLTKTLGIIKTARNMATTATPIAISGKRYIPTNGYGVYINRNPAANEFHLTLFASFGDDDSDPNTYNEAYDKQTPPLFDTQVPPQPDRDYIIEEFRIPNLVDFQYFIFDDGSGTGPVAQWHGSPPSGPIIDATEAVIMFRPPLAETYLGDNATKDLEEISIRFFNPKAPSSSPKKCQIITMNRIKTFPTIAYNNCGTTDPLNFIGK